MFKSGDEITLKTGETGVFVRYYGEKVQIRTPDGKVTGEPAPVAKKPYFAPEIRTHKLGAGQQKVLDAILANPKISYREIGIAAGMPTPRAATIVRTLLDRGIITKTQIEGRNQYGLGTVI